MTFSEKLLRLRKGAGLSQEELAEKLGVSRQAVSRWESGAALPDAPNLLGLSRLFGISIDYLLHDEYEREGDLPAVKESHRKLRAFYRDRLTAGIGRSLGAIGGLGLLGLYIGSRLRPADHMALDGYISRGIWGFLKYYGLDWLFWTCAAVFAVGVAAALWPKARDAVKKWLYSRGPD